LIHPAANHPERLAKFKLESLDIANRGWIVGGEEAREYIDVWCRTGRHSALERPFLSFCEDILLDLEAVGTPEQAVQRTCRRWQRFWTEEVPDSFSMEWLYGLTGELEMLRLLVLDHGPAAVSRWTGPEGLDHDFQRGTDIALEVKSGARMPLVIHCGINQLDPGIFRDLYLASFLLQPSDTGVTLVDLVHSIELLLRDHEDVADDFYARLFRAGYRRQLEITYSERALIISAPEYFRVDYSFPKLTLSSFVEPPDSRIRNIRYELQLSGLAPLSHTSSEVRAMLAKIVSSVS
jgi:hypothetical protein